MCTRMCMSVDASWGRDLDLKIYFFFWVFFFTGFLVLLWLGYFGDLNFSRCGKMCFCRCPCGVWICFFGRIWFWEILALRGFIYELLLLCWLVCVEIWIFVIVKGCNFVYSQVYGSKHLIKKNIVYWWCSSTTCEFKVARADRCLLLRLNLISMVFLFCYHQMKHNTKTERRFRKKKTIGKGVFWYFVL